MQKQIAVRVPDPLIERLEALKAALEADSHYAVRGPWNTSAVLREVIIRGVAALEEELGETN
jgi:predicted DNA-binding protein